MCNLLSFFYLKVFKRILIVCVFKKRADKKIPALQESDYQFGFCTSLGFLLISTWGIGHK